MDHTLQSSLIASSSFSLAHPASYHCCFDHLKYAHLDGHLLMILHPFTRTILYPKLAYFHQYLFYRCLSLLHFIFLFCSQIAHFYRAHLLLLLFKKNSATILLSRSFCSHRSTHYDFLNEYLPIFQIEEDFVKCLHTLQSPHVLKVEFH